MLKKLSVVILSLVTIVGSAQNNDEIPDQITDGAHLYLITCGPGGEIWSHFGHTALEVVDPELRIDITFNYGMFQFDDNFIYKFAKRDVLYFLDVTNTRDFVYSYVVDSRAVYRQEILVSSESKKEIYRLLREDYTNPKKRYYLYEFFFDNCATRPRDVIQKAVFEDDKNNEWHQHEHHLKFTFREIINEQFKSTPWVDFGIDMVLGAPIDRKATSNELMFYPLYLAEIGSFTKVDNQSLLGDEEILNQGSYKDAEPFWLTPEIVFWTLFGIMLVLYLLPYRGWIRYMDSLFLLIFGFLGVLLVFMWFGTLHPGTKDNYNLIWATPLHLFTIPLIFIKRLREKIAWYFVVMTALLFLFMLTFWLLPQSFHPASKPIVLILLVIYYRYHKLIRNKVPLK